MTTLVHWLMVQCAISLFSLFSIEMFFFLYLPFIFCYKLKFYGFLFMVVCSQFFQFPFEGWFAWFLFMFEVMCLASTFFAYWSHDIRRRYTLFEIPSMLVQVYDFYSLVIPVLCRMLYRYFYPISYVRLPIPHRFFVVNDEGRYAFDVPGAVVFRLKK